MFSGLHIRNYVLIDSLDVDFPEGLVIITGQTGAGKSILLGALSLVSGARADAACITAGAQSCVVEAEFDVPDDSPSIRGIFDENELEWDAGHIIIRRVVNSTGRSRGFVNDSPVPVQVLSSLASFLIDIHSQHQSLLLTDRDFQLSVLDRYAGNKALLGRCRESWQECQNLRREIEDVRERLMRASAEQGYNEAQFNELEAAALRDGELEELEEEQKALENAEQILENLSAASSLFSPDEYQGARSMGSALKEAERLLGHVSRFLPSLSSLCDRISSARVEIEDISAEIEDAAAKVNVSEDRLQQVDERLSALYKLMTKHGCRTVGELIATRDRYSEELFDSSALVEREHELAGKLSAAEKALNAVCASLHESRAKAAPGFAASITDSLHFLELERSSFAVELQPRPECATGTDTVSFRFSASGTDLQDVSKCASGGELSRIMLSLKAMMARSCASDGGSMPTMIFDEIDTGVSGSVADKMGSMICAMGEDMQIFSITHLPQVAAKGKAHYVVSKTFDPATGRPSSGMRLLQGEDRIMEIARLLSGSTITPEAIANAKSLL